MADKNGTSTSTPPFFPQELVLERVVVSAKDAPVTETALILSDAALAQLVIRAPIPPSAK